MKKAIIGLIVVFAWSTSCGRSGGGKGTEKPAPTYWGDVAPLYNDKCVKCHQAGGIGPFALDSYAQAKMMAPASLVSIEAGRMPPYLIEADGSCGEFDGVESLNKEQKDMLRAWIDSGMTEGTPVTIAKPEVPQLKGGTGYELPSFVPKRVGGALAEFDEYRCFLVEPGDAIGKYVTGYEVKPGNPKIVHHVLLYTVDTAAPSRTPNVTNGEEMKKLDDLSPDRLGWPCFSGAGDTVAERDSVVDWAPGQGIVEYPGKTGVQVTSSMKFVAQVHYNLADAANIGQADQTALSLRLESTVEQRLVSFLPDLFLGSLAPGRQPASLPPMQASTTFTWSVLLSESQLLKRMFGGTIPNLEAVQVFPHMHERGRKMKVFLKEGDKTECVARTDRYNFGWQRFYRYKTRPLLTPTKTLEVTCDYDTSRDTAPVLPGWGTRNEMCMPIFMLAVPTQ
jgi:Copper type II ascorbate-dependent monooxygenase, C-terminal domain